MKPLVSVVMAVHNNVADLPCSVSSILEQTFRDFEFVIVDDGSTDGSSERLDQYARDDSRVRVIHQQNSGLGPALHNGCKVASGNLIARQDADDKSRKDRLSNQIKLMEENQSLALCGTWTAFHHPIHGEQYSVRFPNNPALLRKLLVSGTNPLSHGSVMFRRSAYLKEGIGYRFRTNVQDYDLWLRLIAFGEMGMLESVEYDYAISVQSLTFQRFYYRMQMHELARRLFNERQANGKELTNWLEFEEELRSRKGGNVSTEEKETLDRFMHGMRCLKRRRYEEFFQQMREAANGAGAKARTAQRIAVLAGLPSFMRPPIAALLRLVVLARNRNLEKFIVYAP
jgi:glycosyltransferase involved in cell wall biosynthesis